MANTVSVLSYAANTFGDWVIATNALIGENNTLGKGNYTKDSGTLYLNDASLGLQVANGAIVQGQLRVQGVGSSAVIEKNLTVENQAYFQNTQTSFIASGNSEIKGVLTANASGIGLHVANNATVGGNVTISGNSTTNGHSQIVGYLEVDGTTTLNSTLDVTGNVTFDDSLVVTNSIDADVLTVADTTTTDYLTVGQNIGAGGSATIRYNILTDKLQANTHVNTATAFISGTTYSPVVRANTSVNTAAISVTGTATTNNLTSNTGTITTLQVTFQDIFGQSNINSITANTGVVRVLSGANSFYDTVRANVHVSASTLFANNLTSNTVNASANIVTPLITVRNKIDANAANIFTNNLETLGQLSVGGNFVLNGTTVYNTNTFTINAGSATGLTSRFSVNRGSSGANAEIRWSESAKEYQLNDVDNGQYYRILTNEFLSDSTSVTSSSNVATSAVANTLNNYINTANSFLTATINAGNTWSQANVGTALATARTYTNTANTYLQSYVDGVVTTKVDPAFTRANTGLNLVTGTSGTATPSPTGSTTGITMSGANGVTIVASSNTLVFSTPQDLRRTAAPRFTGLELTSTALAIGSGGTGGADRVTALTNLLPDASGVPAGYVLGTQGVGSYLWVAGGTGGGGGGTQPGSRITSTRSTATGDGSTRTFTAPTFTNGANQLRVYLDGVRQYEGYTESGTTGVVFTIAPASGVKILFEVDAYMVYAYYANNITITTPIGAIPATANTIELAISNLETRKAALSGATFTGHTMGLTVDTAASNTSFATTKWVKDLGYITTTSADGSYPTKAGTGATGNWGINVTGWAGAVGSATESIGIPAGGVAPGANKLVRTQGNGYTFVNYINSDTGRSENETPSQFIITNAVDNYYRKVSVNKARDAIQSAGITATGVPASGITGQTGMYTDANRPGPYRLYRRDDSSNYSVQTYWTGSYWRLYGYNGDTAHADTHVGYADNATAASYASRLNNSYAFTNGSDGWFRSKGAAGWYNEDYGGGIYMEDTSWVRVYNSKAFYVANEIAASGNITAYYSDERLKDRKGNITGALDSVLKLNGFRYTNNDVAKQHGYTDDEVQIGVSAQEVESFYPEIVKLAPFDMKTLEDGTIVSASGKNYKTVDYSKLVPVLIEAIKELKAEVEQLKGQNK